MVQHLNSQPRAEWKPSAFLSKNRPHTVSMEKYANRQEQGEIVTKKDLARHYGVGVRTVEEWDAMKILVGQRMGRRKAYNVAACDERVRHFVTPVKDKPEGDV